MAVMIAGMGVAGAAMVVSGTRGSRRAGRVRAAVTFATLGFVIVIIAGMRVAGAVMVVSGLGGSRRVEGVRIAVTFVLTVAGDAAGMRSRAACATGKLSNISSKTKSLRVG
jgi:hypothetical protein